MHARRQFSSSLYLCPSSSSSLSLRVGGTVGTRILLCFALAVSLAGSALAANTPETLHAFQAPGDSGDGGSLYSSLTLDSAGNAYGTTVDGGAYNAGIVYELSPEGGGQWKETILYNFKGGSVDGSGSHANLVFDSAGNLYGTTVGGGLTAKGCGSGCGIVFKLSPSADGGEWTETILHEFTGGSDGGVCYSGVIMDSAGNLYGTNIVGGVDGVGTAYELSPTSNADWQETVLHSFSGGHDGAMPFAGVILDQSGNLYGTTQGGGTAGVGVAYELTAAGNWKETILHEFLGLEAADGANPNGLVFDQSGNLYGTTVGGGKFNPGTIFRLSRHGSEWKETVLYSFTAGNDGAYPSAAPTLDSAGNLYGTTLWGGPAGDTVGGVAFELVP